MWKFIENITGITKIKEEAKKASDNAAQLVKDAEEAANEAAEKAEAAKQEQKLAEEAEAIAKMTPKERATKKKLPWVDVIETHINEDNIRNGFFELDWNEMFILKLRHEGYGTADDPEEEIIDRWFRELCAGVVIDGDYGGATVGAGSVIETLKKDN